MTHACKAVALSKNAGQRSSSPFLECRSDLSPSVAQRFSYPTLERELSTLHQTQTLLRAQARDELISAVCRKEMAVYTAIFGTTGETAALERTDRRYLWLRKRLTQRAQVTLPQKPASNPN